MGRPRGQRRDAASPLPTGATLWIWGLHSVEETLAARPEGVREVWFCSAPEGHGEGGSAAQSDLARRARQAGASVRFVGRVQFEKLPVPPGRRHDVAALIAERPEEDFRTRTISGQSRAPPSTSARRASSSRSGAPRRCRRSPSKPPPGPSKN
ncbi:MAG: hypothetical protein FD126_3759 [Elusimicrobia bacterium]|nr:MAG: hypothetical protein FD126_3759 [Elusimicrobiota bacterium]